MELGKLEIIPLREAWKHEAINFTNWLAKVENLKLLSDEIGIDISLIQIEKSVGKFSVDIFAEEENRNKKIVIENQLESTNHDHLGKIITYASGLNAETIIWIVKDVRDEHKQAIDWLNENTNEKINFFAINIELWKIGNSPYAPKFNIISKPNNWAKALQKSSSTQPSTNNTTDLQMKQFNFWESFNNYLQDNNSNINPRKPNPQHWYDIAIGNSKAYISLAMNTQRNYMACSLYIPNSKELFYKLEEHKDEIQKELNLELIWRELPNSKASRILIQNNDFDLSNIDAFENYYEWFMKNAENMKKVFLKYIQLDSNLS